MNTYFLLKHLYGLLQLFKTLAKKCVKEFVLQQGFRLLAESFIRGGSRDPATRNMKVFATIVHGHEIGC